jgi:putative transposase
MIESSTAYQRHHLPARLIACAVWRYCRFPLRRVEELLLERGILVSDETIRRWAATFGPAIARSVRRHAPRPGDIWHLDEVRVVIRGEVHWLGGRSTSTASCSTRSCSAAGTSGRPRGGCARG